MKFSKLIVLFVLLSCLLIGCGTPPSQSENLNSPIPYVVNTQSPTSSPELSPSFTAPNIEKTMSTLNVEEQQTRLYTVSIDATVEMINAKSVDDLIVQPRKIMPLKEYDIVLPEQFSSRISQNDYYTRILVQSDESNATWNLDITNQFQDGQTPALDLDKDSCIQNALEFAKKLGFQNPECIKTEAYGASSPNPQEQSFYCVYVRSNIEGVGVTAETRWSTINTELQGQYFVYMEDKSGNNQIKLSPFEVVERIDNDSELLSLEQAIQSFYENLDNSVTACVGEDCGNYVVNRVALEYVPAKYNSNGTQNLVPAWTFSSGLNYGTNIYMSLWIDARTGEIIR